MREDRVTCGAGLNGWRIRGRVDDGAGFVGMQDGRQGSWEGRVE
jgi:hypothetical protein